MDAAYTVERWDRFDRSWEQCIPMEFATVNAAQEAAREWAANHGLYTTAPTTWRVRAHITIWDSEREENSK